MFLLKRVVPTFLLIIIVLAAATVGASAQCKAFPDSPLWKPLSHERAKNYVDRKLGGDWTPYITHLQKQLSEIRKIMASGKGARLRQGRDIVTLSGEKLAQYLRLSEIRLEVVQCLAVEAGPMVQDGFVETDDDEAPVTEVIAPERANPPRAGFLKIEVSTSCANGVARFKVKNTGPVWPKAGSFSVYRIDGNKKYVVSSRRLRLKKGQIVSFAVKKSKNPTGNLGLFVEPSWYDRPFAYDATLHCV